MTTANVPSRRLVALIIVSVVVGAPLVYLVWEEINELLTGQVVGTHLAVAFAALVALLLLLWFIGRLVRPTPPSERT